MYILVAGHCLSLYKMTAFIVWNICTGKKLQTDLYSFIKSKYGFQVKNMGFNHINVAGLSMENKCVQYAVTLLMLVYTCEV